MTDISVSIVTHNSAKVVKNLLGTLFECNTKNTMEVYVVDNGSSDDTVKIVKESFPNVHIIEQENKGFGAGHNAVLSKLDSKYHAIINPDIHFESDTLSELYSFMEEHPDVAICNPIIHNPDGSRQEVPCKQPKYRYQFSRELEKFGGIFKKWRDEYTMRNVPTDKPFDVEFCTGCFMFIRTSVYKELEGFDDRFFLYCEDADLTRRAMKKGRAVCVTSAIAIHDWERGSGHNFKLLRIHLASMRKYSRKWRKEKS